MKIISEKTNKTYNSVEECMEDEKRFDEIQATKAAEEERKKAERGKRRQEIHDMRKRIDEMKATYVKKIQDYEKDYHCYCVGNSDEEEETSPMAFFRNFW